MKSSGTKQDPVFAAARQRLSQRELASLLEVSPRTVARWEKGETPITGVLLLALKQIVSQGVSPAREHAFTFIDLFAGIGGTRLGFEAHGGGCVFTSEWDTQSQKTYSTNFQDGHLIAGDIHSISSSDIPDHDVLVAGFPCQPFSIAGVSKKNALGNPHGFACKTQGTLFFELARIISEKQPGAFVLENVKNLERHDKGRTFAVIMDTLQSQLGYTVFHRVIDAKPFVPQHRERIFIVGFREPTDFDWKSLRIPRKNPTLAAILHPQDGSEAAEEPYTTGSKAKVAAKYTLTDHLWNYLQRYAEKHRAKGNGFGFGLVEPDGTSRTLSARYYKDGSEILIYQGKRKNPRRLTPRECARLMGFPDSYRIPVSDTQAYKQFGNSVVVPVVAAVAKEVARTLVGDKRALA
jgi:DNA (cytosine-5)-methyltransferase 1